MIPAVKVHAMKQSTMTANKQASVLPQSKRYEFQERIGTGGMGTVYRALDRETNQPVAIKVLKVKYTENPTLHRRLAREFRAASELEHPNIVHALELQTDGESSFVVFELVEGCSLGARIDKEHGLPEAEAIRIITQVTQALDYAHRRKVVHRDVKPDNILLLPDGRAKLTDFGLAKDYGENRDDDLTRNASAMGTPNFMAPEQFVNAKTAGTLCDIYSLGATLYNALTGAVPFTAKTPVAILNKKMKGDYKPVRSLVSGVSERVEAAIASCLSPDPARRPPTCLAFFKILTARDRAEAGPLRTISQPLAAAMPEKNANRRACLRFPPACRKLRSRRHWRPRRRRLRRDLAPRCSGRVGPRNRYPARTPVRIRDAFVHRTRVWQQVSAPPTPAQNRSSDSRSGRPLDARVQVY